MFAHMCAHFSVMGREDFRNIACMLGCIFNCICETIMQQSRTVETEYDGAHVHSLTEKEIN